MQQTTDRCVWREPQAGPSRVAPTANKGSCVCNADDVVMGAVEGLGHRLGRAEWQVRRRLRTQNGNFSSPPHDRPSEFSHLKGEGRHSVRSPEEGRGQLSSRKPAAFARGEQTAPESRHTLQGDRPQPRPPSRIGLRLLCP